MRMNITPVWGKSLFIQLNVSFFRFFPRSVAMSSKNLSTIAVCQLNCTSDRKKNFEICQDLIDHAAKRQAKMVFLPECFDHVGESKAQSLELAESLDGPLMNEYRKLASENSVWLSLGGFHEKDSSRDSSRVSNSHVLINPDGGIASVYRKVHLFDCDIPGGVRLKESDYTIPGSELVPPVNTTVGKVGLGICYDLRFPEFSLALTKAGAEILTYPSAFTQTTGMAHWESLLRSRAIESQCYVVAAAQTGKHNMKRTSYGHAMVVDPWGCVIAHCSEGAGIAFAEINLDYVRKVRLEMPVSNHRRLDLYGAILPPNDNPRTDSDLMFGPIKLHPDYIFYRTKHSIAFVNRKTVVPGHVLVTPLRIAKRLADLNNAEVADLFLCVQTVQKQIERAYQTNSSCIAIQDGPDAGQTVPHVHVHILPRKAGDFPKNDDVYEKLANHDKGEDIKWRTPEDMIDEAKTLKEMFL